MSPFVKNLQIIDVTVNCFLKDASAPEKNFQKSEHFHCNPMRDSEARLHLNLSFVEDNTGKFVRRKKMSNIYVKL